MYFESLINALSTITLHFDNVTQLIMNESGSLSNDSESVRLAGMPRLQRSSGAAPTSARSDHSPWINLFSN